MLLISVRTRQPALKAEKAMHYNTVRQLFDAPGPAIAQRAKLSGSRCKGGGTPDGRGS